MERLWLCFNCEPHTEFQGPLPVCPVCKADGKDPKAAGCIAPRMVIHFDPPHAVFRGKGVGFHACDPKAQVGTLGMRASGDIRAVNCPACLASEPAKKMADDLETPHAYRVPPTAAEADAKLVAEGKIAAGVNDSATLAKPIPYLVVPKGYEMVMPPHDWQPVAAGGPLEESAECGKCGKYANSEGEQPCEPETTTEPATV